MPTLNARSSPAGYVVLAGIWIVFSIGSAVLEFIKHVDGNYTASEFTGIIAILWVVWLRGFRLRITNDVLEYRNGFYQTRSCLLADVEGYEVKWIKWKVLWRRLKVPRGVVTVRDQDPILINIKPFSRADLATLRHLLR